MYVDLCRWTRIYCPAQACPDNLGCPGLHRCPGLPMPVQVLPRPAQARSCPGLPRPAHAQACPEELHKLVNVFNHARKDWSRLHHVSDNPRGGLWATSKEALGRLWAQPRDLNLETFSLELNTFRFSIYIYVRPNSLNNAPEDSN